MGRSTKQKDLIHKTLTNLKTHPTIKELYDEVKSKDNSLGQATVYRNINKLYENGLIRRIIDKDGTIRYDGDISYHGHLICEECNKLIDLDNLKLDINTIDDISRKNNCYIKSYDVIIRGLCSECLNKNKKEGQYGIKRNKDRTKFNDSFCRRKSST